MNGPEQISHRRKTDELEAKLQKLDSDFMYVLEEFRKETVKAMTNLAADGLKQAEALSKLREEFGETMMEARTELRAEIDATRESSLERRRSWRQRWRWLLKGY